MNHHKNKKSTSIEALGSIESFTDQMRARVAAFIRQRKHRGTTDKEIQEALDMNGDTQRPRRWELMEEGLVKDSGERRFHYSLRSSIVWVWVADQGEREVLREQSLQARKKRSLVHSVANSMEEMSISECESVEGFVKNLLTNRGAR